MRHVRASVPRWAVLVLALSVSSFVTPHAGLYFHHHVGGNHLHLHFDDDEDDHDAAEHPPLGHHCHADRHRPQLTHAEADGPVIEAPDDDGTGHWHSREVFRRGVEA